MAHWPESKRNDGDGYWWDLVAHTNSAEAIRACALELAEYVAEGRLPPKKLLLWKQIRDKRHKPTSADQLSLRVYFQMDFGLPGTQPAEHRLEAAVSEALWRRCVSSRTEASRSLEQVFGHSIDVTDHGGDGLVVYREDNQLCFRLWEIKKHVAKNDLRDTVTGAHRQLDENALGYLARFSLAYRDSADSAVAAFMAELVDRWLERSPTAGAGVAVASELCSQSDDAFDGLRTRFPEFKGRLEGLANIFVDYTAFCEIVQAEIWKGL